MFIVQWQNETGGDTLAEVETMEQAKAVAARYYADNDAADVEDDTIVVYANTAETDTYPEPVQTWTIDDFNS